MEGPCGAAMLAFLKVKLCSRMFCLVFHQQMTELFRGLYQGLVLSLSPFYFTYF